MKSEKFKTINEKSHRDAYGMKNMDNPLKNKSYAFSIRIVKLAKLMQKIG